MNKVLVIEQDADTRSALTDLLTTYLVFVIGRRLHSTAVGLLAAFFLKERARDTSFLVTDAVEPTAA